MEGATMLETRSLTETVRPGTAARRATGYAARFNSRSHDLGGFVEVIEPGAFAESLATSRDIIATFNHDETRLLGRTSSGTLHVYEDERGLGYDLDLPDTTVGRDVAELLSRGDLTGSSFRFRPQVVDWDTTESGYPLRRVVTASLVELGPVTMPAYQESTAMGA